MASLVILILLLGAFSIHSNAAEDNFHAYYYPSWGLNQLSINPEGTEVQLMVDKSSGSGFRSKLEYGSGLFHVRMKIPADKKGVGINTNFYLSSGPADGEDDGNHYELYYEFLGTNGTLQTNVFDSDRGHREEIFNLWFDPSHDFHSYNILWNSDQIMFFVDEILIRVFKNNVAKGIPYPNRPMHVEASIRNALQDSSKASSSLKAYYQDFGFSACAASVGEVSNCASSHYWNRPKHPEVSSCASSQYFWNQPEYRELSDAQKQQLLDYRRKYMIYNYCSEESNRMKECLFNT